jgi:hypothetical protein
VAAEPQRLAGAGQINLFLAFGERQQRRRLDLLVAEGGQGRVQLSFAAVDQQDVGKDLVLVQSRIPPRDDFVDAAEVVDAPTSPRSCTADSRA